MTWLPVLLAAGEQQDPLALIIGAGGGCIGILATIAWTLARGHVGRLDQELRYMRSTLEGRDGMTMMITDMQGRLRTAEAEIAALKAGTLTRQVFEREMEFQNGQLAELKTTTKELDGKVDKIARPPWRSDSPPGGTPYKR